MNKIARYERSYGKNFYSGGSVSRRFQSQLYFF